MPPWLNLTVILDVSLWVTSAIWGAYALERILTIGRIRELPPIRSETSAAGTRVTVIVPSRDPDRRLGPALLRWTDQRCVDLELLVVDDRSSVTGTATIRDAVAGAPAARYLRIDRLPDGWLGKPHACAVAAAEARGEWLLFTDADVWVEPDVIARALAIAEGEEVEHVALFPAEHRTSFAARVLASFMITAFVPIIARVNRDRPDACVGIGAFNLVRADAYRAIGGHESLRFEVVDDVKLGLLLRRAGYRTRALGSAGAVEVEWGGTVRQIFRAVEKNLFALFGYRVDLTLLIAIGPLLPWSLAVVGPFTGRAAGLAAGIALAAAGLPATKMSRGAGWGVLPGLLSPLALPLTGLITLRTLWKNLRAGGICWRGTFYGLPELRARQVRWPSPFRRP